MFASLVVAALMVHAPAWHHRELERRSGAVEASVSYDERSFGFSRDVRDARLVVRLRGHVVIQRRLPTLNDGTVTVLFRDVWGTKEPEVLVRAVACGNHCGYFIGLAIPQTGVLLTKWFYFNDYTLGAHQIVSRDDRFFCFFASCAESTTPIRVFTVNRSGTRLVDISRSRPKLLLRDALLLRPLPGSADWMNVGVMAPYCADEYRLGRYAHCDRVLPRKVRRQLVAWGYR